MVARGMFSEYGGEACEWVKVAGEDKGFDYWDWFSKYEYALAEGWEMRGKGKADDFVVLADDTGFLLYLY